MVNKYRAIKTVVDGIKFDSRLESEIYDEIKLRVKLGTIKSFSLQPVYELLPRPNRITYRGDFLIETEAFKAVVDAKGMLTPAFRLKKKMFHHFYPDLPLLVVKSRKQLREML